MKTLLLILFLAVLPLFFGHSLCAAAAFFPAGKKSKTNHRKASFDEKAVLGTILLLGLAELAHLAAFVQNKSLGAAARYFAYFLIATATFSYLILILTAVRAAISRLKNNQPPTVPTVEVSEHPDLIPALLYVCSGLLALGLTISIGAFGSFSISGDQTLETVQTFLANEAPLYSINPLTGLPFATGMPSRLKVLSLPTLYGILCRTFDVSPVILVCRIMPIFWMICGICAYSSLGRALFPDKEEKRARAFFLLFVLLLCMATCHVPGLEGFSLLHEGYRAAAIRCLVLVPYLLSLLLQKKYAAALLPLAAEFCILWTLAGTGATLIIYIGVLLLQLVLRRKIAHREEEQP